MSYSFGGSLQSAVYAALIADSALNTLIGGAVYDAAPPGVVPETYVILGEEEVRDASDMTGSGADHRFKVTVISTLPGFATAKAVAARCATVLQGDGVSLSQGCLAYLTFDRARAVRAGSADTRRIDLRFRARVEPMT